MAERTQVVCTTVGPYRADGLLLVDACIAAGTDYVDLTGEVLFVHESIERHDAAAAAGARIVHSCGFDSIPSDMGVFVLHEKVTADGAGDLEETTYVVRGSRGGVSGGTLASMLGQLDDMRATPDDEEDRQRSALAVARQRQRRRRARPDEDRPRRAERAVDRAVRDGRRSTRASCGARTR